MIDNTYLAFLEATYAAMEPRQYRESGMSVSEGRNGGDAKAWWPIAAKK